MSNIKNYMVPSFICSCLLLLGMEQDAHAYLDPGTGTFLLQLLIGAFITVPMMVKIYWQKIKSFFSGNKQQIDNEDTPTSEVEESQSVNEFTENK